jgi:hypothetical protein
MTGLRSLNRDVFACIPEVPGLSNWVFPYLTTILEQDWLYNIRYLDDPKL